MHHALNKRIKYHAPEDYEQEIISEELQTRYPRQPEKSEAISHQRRRKTLTHKTKF